ncbi:MAG: NAD(P)H-dependent oxidoreductase [Desulfatiglandales bacterium]
MKITILNGNPNVEDSGFDDYLTKFKTVLESRDHTVMILQLRDMDIRYCIGCWVKTPGECSNAADDTRVVRREYINSGLVIFASPVIMGFTSALLKKAHDRLIPLLTPYTRLFNGESHHVARYDKYPLIGLLLQPDGNTDAEDMEIISEIYRRDAINFKASFIFAQTTGNPVEEVADAIAGI